MMNCHHLLALHPVKNFYVKRDLCVCRKVMKEGRVVMIKVVTIT